MLNRSPIIELQVEGAQTRKMLSRVPFDRFDWKPHGKSMNLGRLATHIAELPGFIPVITGSTFLDVLQMKRQPSTVTNNEDLLALHDRKLEEAIAALTAATDEELMTSWSLRRGETVMFTLPRISGIRTLAMNHIVHHRGQLAVFLRLNDVPVPGMYGPSADEM
jgi:uncharacterized damage-inducible protein DinB